MFPLLCYILLVPTPVFWFLYCDVSLCLQKRKAKPKRKVYYIIIFSKLQIRIPKVLTSITVPERGSSFRKKFAQMVIKVGMMR